MLVSSSAIETVSGRFVDIANPNPADIIPSDIAWALSHIPRFCGHTKHALPYTVAQHSIRVADIVREVFTFGSEIRLAAIEYFTSNPINTIEYFLFCDVLKFIKEEEECPRSLYLYALLHDASEVFCSDLPSPVKSLPGLKEAYAEIEDRMMSVIHKRFGLERDIILNGKVMHAITHWADLFARTIEAYHLMPSKGLHWRTGNVKVSQEQLQNFDGPKEQDQVYKDFLECLTDFT